MGGGGVICVCARVPTCVCVKGVGGCFSFPELVTLLKGHSLSPRGCPLTLSAPSERFGY